MDSPQTKNFFYYVKEYWLLVAFIVQIIITWNTYGTRIQSAEASIKELTESDKRDKIVLSEINSRLASIDTSLSFLTGERYVSIKEKRVTTE